LVDVEDMEIDEIFEDNLKRDGSYNLEGVLDRLIDENIIEKPKFDYDERWYPSPDDRIVNENVNYRLDDINI